MPCYNPTRVIMDGDKRIQWNQDWRNARYFSGQTQINIPCRDCIGCRQAGAREWSIRCFHEAQCHTVAWRDADTRITTKIPNSCVLTMTYNQEHLPSDGLLDHSEFQRFMKRLRNKLVSDHKLIKLKNAPPIKFFMAGEYGGLTHRPHFHCILFGYHPNDMYPVRIGNQNLQMSHEVTDLWSKPPTPGHPSTPIGNVFVDTFSFAGAAYVAGYIAKKMVPGEGHFGPTQWTQDDLGNLILKPISPEYRRMSNRPGLGHQWISRWENMQRTYSDDVIRIGEWKFHPPKYYDNVLKDIRPDLVQDILDNRHEGAILNAEEWSQDRCSAAEQIALTDLQRRRDSL